MLGPPGRLVHSAAHARHFLPQHVALHVAGGPTWPPLESAREWFVPHATRAKWMPLGILRMRGLPALPSCSPMPAYHLTAHTATADVAQHAGQCLCPIPAEGV